MPTPLSGRPYEEVEVDTSNLSTAELAQLGFTEKVLNVSKTEAHQLHHVPAYIRQGVQLENHPHSSERGTDGDIHGDAM